MNERHPEDRRDRESESGPAPDERRDRDIESEKRRAPVSAELRPFVDRSEAAEIDAVADRLRATRPKPDPEFREALGQALASRSARTGANLTGPRLHAAVAGLAGSGAVLLLLSYLVAR